MSHFKPKMTVLILSPYGYLKIVLDTINISVLANCLLPNDSSGHKNLHEKVLKSFSQKYFNVTSPKSYWIFMNKESLDIAIV